MGRLEGKTALITGAARGIGKGIAERFAMEGANLSLLTKSTPLDETLEACHKLGVRAEGMAMDVSDPVAAKNSFDKHIETFGGIDILVNNAGITRDGLFVRMKDKDFDDVIRVNLVGAFNLMRAAARVMMKRRSGRIINITSVVGQVGNAGQANYAASKAGLTGLTKSAAKELASRSVTVNAIAPGYIVTAMTEVLTDSAKGQLLESIPLGRFGSVEDVAGAAVFLASDEAGYITGQTLSVNGGMAM